MPMGSFSPATRASAPKSERNEFAKNAVYLNTNKSAPANPTPAIIHPRFAASPLHTEIIPAHTQLTSVEASIATIHIGSPQA